MTSTYSSSLLRDRDKAIHDKYQNEIKNLEAKVERQRRQNDEHMKTIFDSRKCAQRLARSLGFDDVLEAQVAIDSADYSFTLKDTFEHLEVAQAELATQRKEMEVVQEKLLATEEKLKSIEHENKRLLKERSDLETRYDALLHNKERANERYKADFKKWQKLYSKDHPKDTSSRLYEHAPDLLPEEKQRRMMLIGEHRVRLLEMLPKPSAAKDSPSTAKESGIDKENQGTPISTTTNRKRPFGSENSEPPSPVKKPSTPTLPLRNTLLKSVTNTAVPSSSPTVFNAQSSAMSRVPLAFQPISDTIHIKKEPSPVNLHPLSSPLPKPHIPSSSDTEDDSQAIPHPMTDSRTGKTVIYRIPAPSAMAGPSRSGGLSSITPILNLPPRPSIYEASPKRTFESGSDIAQLMRARQSVQLHQVESERPNKLRRLSENSHELSRGSSAITNISKISNSHSDPRPSVKGKERAADNALSTPLTTRNLGQKRIEDYSAFKGRGRYGKVAEGPQQTTINALYAIDPAKNGGKDFQFDEVVRNREERRKMNAGDCECCREYYENVGPLPSRLMQPLWRSPPSTPVKPCPRHSHDSSPEDDRRPGCPSSSLHASAQRQSEIESHKKAISRHRHHWERGATPPAYWDIGFPSTQEAGDINEKAKAMHERKKEQVAREAASGGRYRRK